MPDFPPDYVAELYRQTAFMSAVLGGFAVAFLGALLTSDPERRLGTWAVGFASGSAVLFILATFASTGAVLDVTRFGITDFDRRLWPGQLQFEALLSSGAFFLGLYALVAGVGLSGWTRSRATGRATTTIAAVGIVLLTTLLVVS